MHICMYSIFVCMLCSSEVARHLASELSLEIPQRYSHLPRYTPYQVARHLASELGAVSSLRVVALPHTEGIYIHMYTSAERTPRVRVVVGLYICIRTCVALVFGSSSNS